jgi:hypothetical protein
VNDEWGWDFLWGLLIATIKVSLRRTPVRPGTLLGNIDLWSVKDFTITMDLSLAAEQKETHSRKM